MASAHTFLFIMSVSRLAEWRRDSDCSDTVHTSPAAVSLPAQLHLTAEDTGNLCDLNHTAKHSAKLWLLLLRWKEGMLGGNHL